MTIAMSDERVFSEMRMDEAEDMFSRFNDYDECLDRSDEKLSKCYQQIAEVVRELSGEYMFPVGMIMDEMILPSLQAEVDNETQV